MPISLKPCSLLSALVVTLPVLCNVCAAFALPGGGSLPGTAGGSRDALGWLVAVAVLLLLRLFQLRRLVGKRTRELREEAELRREAERRLQENRKELANLDEDLSRNLSENIEFHKELQESMERYRDAHRRLSFNIGRMPLAYIVLDGECRVREWNPAAEKMFGWPASEAVGTPAFELFIPPEARPCVEEVREKLLAGDATSYAVRENLRKDGARITCEWHNTPLRNASGEISGVLCMANDITERRRAEEALQIQAEQISTIFDSINALVYVADLETNELLSMNRFGIESFGDDWQGKTCYEVLQAGQSKVCSFCTNEFLLRDGIPQPPCVWEYQNAITGTWFQCIDRAIRWTDGRLVRMEIAFDITERKELERIKDGMISAVSHEMRTPLTAMLGYTEFMLENEVDPRQQREFLTIVHEETVQLSELIGNFLDLQRYRANQGSHNFRSVSLRPFLEETALLFGAISPKHRLAMECPPDLPPVRGDAAQLRQVLRNLISNAVKYSPEGGTVLLGARRDDDGIIIYVKDEGIGIPAALLDKVFERFYRVDNTDRRMVGGTGLGLALVKEIVNAHGGWVWADSEVGKGSTFNVYLPFTG